MHTEEFTDEPLDPVSNHSATSSPARGDSDPRPLAAGDACDYDERPANPPLTAALQLEVLRSLSNAPRARETSVRSRQYGCFGGTATVSRLRPLARRRFNT
jgi:hypothetical protein